MTKQDLQGYKHIKAEIRQIEAEIRELDARVYSPRTPHLTGMPGAASTERGSAQERAATELFELKETYEAKIRELLRKKRWIEQALDALPDPQMRMIMRGRYIRLYSWARISREMNYCESAVKKKHAKALDMLKCTL